MLNCCLPAQVLATSENLESIWEGNSHERIYQSYYIEKITNIFFIDINK